MMDDEELSWFGGSIVEEFLGTCLYAEDASGKDIKEGLLRNLRKPKDYPTVCADEGWNPTEVPVCYDPRSPQRVTLSIDLSRASTWKEAATILQEIAARRGLTVARGWGGAVGARGYAMVFSTARKWYCHASPCRESTYTHDFSVPPAEAT